MLHLWAICFLVCPSVLLLVIKFMVEVVFDEVEIQSTWNLVHMCSSWYDLLNFTAKLKILPNFHSQLNIENDCTDGKSMYLWPFLVWRKKYILTIMEQSSLGKWGCFYGNSSYLLFTFFHFRAISSLIFFCILI